MSDEVHGDPAASAPWQLRIHGVAGTPARHMLELDAIPPAGADPDDPPDVAVFAMPTSVETRRALTWSSLTSGAWWHALYILLVPFMLLNVAGWTLPSGPREHRIVRLRLLLVRLAGVLLTAIWMTLVFGGTVDVLARRVVVGGDADRVVAGGAVLGAALLGLVLSWLTRVRPHPGAPVHDHLTAPVDLAASVSLSRGQRRMWTSPVVARTLHGAHSVVLVGVVAVLSGIAGCTSSCTPGGVVDDLGGSWTIAVLLGTLCVGAALVVVAAMTFAPDGRVPLVARLGGRLWLALVALGLVGVVAGAWAWSQVAPDVPLGIRPRGLLGSLGLEAAGLAGVAALLATTRAWVAAATATLAGVVVAVFGAGFGAALSGVADVPSEPGLDPATAPATSALPPSFAWVALSAAVLAVAVALIAAVLAERAHHGIERRGDGGDALRVVRAVVQPPSRLIVLVGAAAWATTAAVAVVWLTGVAHDTSDLTPLPELPGARGSLAWTLIVLGVVCASWVAVRATGASPWVAAAVPAAAAVVLAIVLGPWAGVTEAAPPLVVLGGIGVAIVLGRLWWIDHRKDRVRSADDLTRAQQRARADELTRTTRTLLLTAGTIVGLAAVAMGLRWIVRDSPSSEELLLLLTLTVPAGFLLARLRGGLGDREARKQSATLWDVGTFWPRWFHPFSPPTYSDVAVQEVAQLVHDGISRYERRVWRLDDEGRERGRVLLAPHSQGTVIAAAAVLLAADEHGPGSCDDVALLTYGSPLRSLYAPMFPSQLGDDAFELLRDVLSHPGGCRWCNLWRDTDPICGPVEPEQTTWGVDVHDDGTPRTRASAAASRGEQAAVLAGHSTYRHGAAWDESVSRLGGTPP